MLIIWGLCIKRNILIPCLLSIVFFCSCPPPVSSDSIHKANVHAELITDVTSVAPGGVFWVGLQMNMDDGWHTYWINSGDSGMPTRMDWNLPEEFTAGETQWPYPKRFDYSNGLAGYGYDGEVLLLTQIKTPDNIQKGESQEIKAMVSWLSCKEICVPGKAELSVSLVVESDEPRVDDNVRKYFNDEQKKWPLMDSFWNISAIDDKETLVLNVSSEIPAEEITGLSFFPYRNDIIDHAAKQVFLKEGDDFQLTVSKAVVLNEPIEHIQGVLVFNEEGQKERMQRSVIVNVPVKNLR